MKRAILCFALIAQQHKHPAQAKAKAFVQRMRQLDAEWVDETVEVLNLKEAPAPKKAPAPLPSK
jgi:hypothetical protein